MFFLFGWFAQADVNMKTKDDVWCPLKIAAYRGFVPAVESLLQLKADLESVRLADNLGGLTPEIKQLLTAAKHTAPHPWKAKKTKKKW